MSSRHTLHTSLLALALSALASPAAADVIPPDVTACDMHTLGSTCSDPAGGVCTMSRCAMLDYAHWDRDASASPPSIERDCVRCIAGGPVDAGSSTDGGGAIMNPPRSTGCSVGHGAGSGVLMGLLAVALAAIGVRRRR